jgi:lipopolysaccharide/colanic/teichoic acid biosynthesis glycosyltransferase
MQFLVKGVGVRPSGFPQPQGRYEVITSGQSTNPTAKRAVDLVALVALAPFALLAGLLIAFAVLLDSPGPVFYRARRIGFAGEPFRMLKFRTMRIDLDGHSIAGSADERITPIGAFLRKTRLDELPQLTNILRGEMSFVGPRPELEEFVELHAEEYREILDVPPGITGPTQLRFAGVEAALLSLQDDPEAFYRAQLLPDKVDMDLRYARTRTFWRDLRYLAETLVLPLILFLQSGPGDRAEGAGRRQVFAGTATAAVILLLPVIFALGLGSPR